MKTTKHKYTKIKLSRICFGRNKSKGKCIIIVASNVNYKVILTIKFLSFYIPQKKHFHYSVYKERIQQMYVHRKSARTKQQTSATNSTTTSALMERIWTFFIPLYNIHTLRISKPSPMGRCLCEKFYKNPLS